MKITLQSTPKLVTIEGPNGTVPARLWVGQDEQGVPVHAFITRIKPEIPINDPRQKMFERELEDQTAHTREHRELVSVDLRLLID